MPYTDGLPAVRRFGADVIDIASKLQETILACSHLGRLCDQLFDVTWREYVINPKDANYYVEKAYWELLKSKADMLKKLEAFKADWDRELVGNYEDSDDGNFDEDCGISKDGSDDGSHDENDAEQVIPPEYIMDTSPDFHPEPDLIDDVDKRADETGFRMLQRLQWL
jgi:hypothetical protein